MAEHDAERAGSDEEREPRPVEGTAVPDEGPDQTAPLDEDAMWAAIVKGYGQEPPDPPGARPFRSIEDLALPDNGPEVLDPDKGMDKGTGKKSPTPPPERPLGSSVVFAPGVGGPRDYELPDAPAAGSGSPDDSDDSDEGHFVPPEPPALPESDAAAKFAWLGVIGGPVLMLVSIVLQWELTWWLTTLCVGGFLGGFATLVARMQSDDEDDQDPGRGAVV
ncbi:hypothetical protein ACPXCE_12445 [Streptomyces sp. DT24]|uniref:hypothetical protein n=1 Tax=unclassified Streptomyces TaxID=2593676 RepID=UPI0023B961A6|nr:hypothetical protein [Streptomyces sp. AM 4-1-1]WEH32981.1 hypothetical protein PZB75_06065 [Streptomyces sp. AM 4-1-1]